MYCKSKSVGLELRVREGGLDMGGTGYILVQYLYGEGGWIKGGLIEGGGCQRMGGGWILDRWFLYREGRGRCWIC